MSNLVEEMPIEQQIIKLTSDIFHKHYCENDIEYVIQQLDDDIAWFGTGEKEYSLGLENVSNIFRQFKGKIPKCNIADENYNVIEISSGAYICNGRMWISTDASTQISLRAHQRITTVFRVKDNKIKCCHIHISNPYMEMVEDDIGFPMKMAKQSYEYLQEQIHEQKRKILEQTAVLEKMSYNDSLTGLYNRNKFNEMLDSDASKYGIYIGVACFDLNGLKEINDKLGHSAGDELIRSTAQQLKKFFDKKAYRTGGDEFVVVDNEKTKDEFYAAIHLTKKMMEENNISCSVGACWRTNNCNIKEQFDRADVLMYEEKRKYYKQKKNERRHFHEYTE